MDSGTIISTLQAEAAAPVADTTDLGLASPNWWRQQTLPAIQECQVGRDPGLRQRSRWTLVCRVLGAMAFLVNADKVPTVPQTWEDLLKPDYKNTVCMKDPRSSRPHR